MNNKRNNRGSRGPVQDGGARYRDRDAFSPDFDENEEEYWEDEEDYEEFARSMDREYGYEDSRQSSARSGRTGRAQNSRSSSGGTCRQQLDMLAHTRSTANRPTRGSCRGRESCGIGSPGLGVVGGGWRREGQRCFGIGACGSRASFG